MQRNQLSHILRAIHSVTGETEFEIYGSQSVLCSHDDIPDSYLTHSDELDVYTPSNSSLSYFISANFGVNSKLASTFGYYADGIDIGNLILPTNYRKRMICRYVSLDDADSTVATVRFLSLEDACAAKLNAGRTKDFMYVAAARDNYLIDDAVFKQCCNEMDNSDYLLTMYRRPDLSCLVSYN